MKIEESNLTNDERAFLEGLPCSFTVQVREPCLLRDDSDLRAAVDAIAKAADGIWELRGDPWRVARLQALMAEAEKQNQWGTKLEALIGMEPYENLRATTDRDLRALATKALYAVLNRIQLFPNVWACHREGFWCEWIYPYGFVPEGGCPRHD